MSEVIRKMKNEVHEAEDRLNSLEVKSELIYAYSDMMKGAIKAYDSEQFERFHFHSQEACEKYINHRKSFLECMREMLYESQDILDMVEEFERTLRKDNEEMFESEIEVEVHDFIMLMFALARGGKYLEKFDEEVKDSEFRMLLMER